jgi:hypothetical protein
VSHAVPPAQYAQAAQEALAKLSPEERRCCRSEAGARDGAAATIGVGLLMPPIDGSENAVDALFNFGHGGFFARCQSAERKLRKEG